MPSCSVPPCKAFCKHSPLPPFHLIFLVLPIRRHDDDVAGRLHADVGKVAHVAGLSRSRHHLSCNQPNVSKT